MTSGHSETQTSEEEAPDRALLQPKLWSGSSCSGSGRGERRVRTHGALGELLEAQDIVKYGTPQRRSSKLTQVDLHGHASGPSPRCAPRKLHLRLIVRLRHHRRNRYFPVVTETHPGRLRHRQSEASTSTCLNESQVSDAIRHTDGWSLPSAVEFTPDRSTGFIRC
jgi:hypothetical protein